MPERKLICAKSTENPTPDGTTGRASVYRDKVTYWVTLSGMHSFIDGGKGKRAPDDYTSTSSPTGQWSLPITSGEIQARFTAERSFCEATK